MASETFKLLTVANSIVGLGIAGAGCEIGAATGVFGKNWETEELEFPVTSAGFPLLEREVEEEGNLKEKGEKVIFTTTNPPGIVRR